MTRPGGTILIKAFGGSKVGMGHVYRSITLARQLSTEFRVGLHVNDDPQVKSLVQAEDFTCFVEDTDVGELIEAEGTDVFIQDQPEGEGRLLEALKTRFPRLKIAALDYFDYDNRFVDVIVNLFNQNQLKPRPDRENVQYYEGLEYAIIREELRRYASRHREVSQKVSRVLVTFGGADPAGNTEKALRLLELTGVSGFHTDVILGPLRQGALHQSPGSAIQLHRSVPPSAMPEFMVDADLAFCGGGTTMLELLSVGTPAIVIPQNPREERFGLSADEKGAVKTLGCSVEQEDVARVKRLLDSPRDREDLSRTGRSLVDGNGVERIHDIMAQMMHRRG